ncbi:MAG: tyrosine-type recombinase/integrase [Candidatus Dormibacteria bacterium]
MSTTALGRPRCGTAVTHTFHRLLVEAGVRQRTVHTLRHSAATLMLAGGVDLKTVSTVLGHSQIGLTADTYASVLPGLQREAAASNSSRLLHNWGQRDRSDIQGHEMGANLISRSGADGPIGTDGQLFTRQPSLRSGSCWPEVP